MRQQHPNGPYGAAGKKGKGKGKITEGVGRFHFNSMKPPLHRPGKSTKTTAPAKLEKQCHEHRPVAGTSSSESHSVPIQEKRNLNSFHHLKPDTSKPPSDPTHPRRQRISAPTEPPFPSSDTLAAAYLLDHEDPTTLLNPLLLFTQPPLTPQDDAESEGGNDWDSMTVGTDLESAKDDDEGSCEDDDEEEQEMSDFDEVGGQTSDEESLTVRNLPKEFSSGMYWKVCKFTPKVVRDSLRRTGFKLIKGGRNWVGYWGKHFPADRFKHVQPWQKVNHYPMSFEIGRKDRMFANVSRIRNRVGPEQRRNLHLVFSQHPLWIIKPPASARGIGIRVAARWKDVPRKREAVVSRYIPNPFLIQGRKFDLRLYVVVTSFDPLRIYLHREGVVRFAADPSFDTLSDYLQTKGHNFDTILTTIKSLIIKTLASTNTTNASGVRLCVSSSSSCYELFGFDVLLDSNLKPWLMEVNISPSLKASGDMDFGIKARMVTDLFNLVGVKVKDVETCRKWLNRKKPSTKPRTGPSPAQRQKHRDQLRNPDFDCLLELNEDDIRVLKESEDENRRRGNFTRLLPAPTGSTYFPFFSHVSYYDRLLDQWTRRSRSDPSNAVLLLQRFPYLTEESLMNDGVDRTPDALAAVFMADSGGTEKNKSVADGLGGKGGKPYGDGGRAMRTIRDSRSSNSITVPKTLHHIIPQSLEIRDAQYPGATPEA
ncbi:Tubulin polyglutamylase ttll4 [Dinochytrium kinnereticum]|nr:Tubulin polyglutamylase ttll4 [Dinochytrium kinnereticum]